MSKNELVGEVDFEEEVWACCDASKGMLCPSLNPGTTPTTVVTRFLLLTSPSLIPPPLTSLPLNPSTLNRWNPPSTTNPLHLHSISYSLCTVTIGSRRAGYPRTIKCFTYYNSLTRRCITTCSYLLLKINFTDQFILSHYLTQLPTDHTFNLWRWNVTFRNVRPKFSYFN